MAFYLLDYNHNTYDLFNMNYGYINLLLEFLLQLYEWIKSLYP